MGKRRGKREGRKKPVTDWESKKVATLLSAHVQKK